MWPHVGTGELKNKSRHWLQRERNTLVPLIGRDRNWKEFGQADLDPSTRPTPDTQVKMPREW